MSLNEHEESELIFGWIDKTKYVGDLKWYPVINKFFWSIALDEVKVNFIILLSNSLYIVKWSIFKSMFEHKMYDNP